MAVVGKPPACPSFDRVVASSSRAWGRRGGYSGPDDEMALAPGEDEAKGRLEGM
jgi:hypothetical protein